jgi:hypothetical protein
MEHSINNFQYRSLQTTPQEFRLVQIQPGALASSISCTLRHAYLKDPPSFEALSYAWGDPRDTISIFLDGQTFSVTNSLESALRHLRWEDAVRTFWIDAICINQLDREERSQQVRFMSKLYTAAERTMVWLGPEDDDAALAFEYMREVQEENRMSLLKKEFNLKLACAEKLATKIIKEAKFPNSPASEHIQLSPRLQPLTKSILLSELEEKKLLEQLFCSKIKLVSIREELEQGKSSFVRASSVSSRTNTRLEVAEEVMYQNVLGPAWTEMGPDVDSIEPDDQDRKSSADQEKWNIHTIRQSFARRSCYFTMTAYNIDLAELSPATAEAVDEAVCFIMERPWWRRIWVVQEIAMSRNVIFQVGNVQASWNAVYSTTEHTPTDFIQGDFPYVLTLLRIWKNNKEKGSELPMYQANLLDLLQQFRHCQATDPRDKVYALLDLAADVSDDDISIDYSLAPQEVYKNIVAFFLSRHKSLDILGSILGEPTLPGLPTWVPDWSFPADDDYEKPFFQKRTDGNCVTKFYNASGNSTVSVDTRCCGDTLVLKGFVFDTVDDLCNPTTTLTLEEMEVEGLSQSIIETYEQQAFESKERLDPYEEISGGRTEAFWRTIVADAIGDQRATEDAAKLFDVWLGRSKAPTGAKYFAEPYEAAVHRASHGRNFGISSRNYMLLVPNATIKGDLICVLLGGQTPFISRKIGGRFHLVGACYIHGIMSGEAMDELRIGKYELQDFTFE